MAKLYIAITVDTEGHKGKNPIDNLVYGKIGREKYGIELIMDICENYGVKAVFFVDLAAAWDFGAKKIKRVIDTITHRGHDAQVHLHPDHMAEQERLFLWEYSRNEQASMIEKCLSRYREFTGHEAIAFRAGKYGANYDTLDILSQYGTNLDFSQFYKQRWCGLNNPSYTVNSIRKYKNTWEIPVTVYKSFDLLHVQRFDKIDLNTITTGEFKKVIRSFQKNDQPMVITFFMHSFSFLKRSAGDNLIKPNWREIKKFRKILSFIKSEPDVEVVTTPRILELIGGGELCRNKDFVPAIRGYFYMIYYNTRRALRIFRTNTKARVFLIIVLLLLVLSGLTLAFLLQLLKNIF